MFQGDGYTNLYWGAAGVMWALHHLANAGAARLIRDYSEPASALHKAYLSDQGRRPMTPVYMVGESGVLLVEFLLAPSPSTLERLHAAVEASLDTPFDLCFGAPGAMVAANVVYRRTHDAQWLGLVQRHLDRLWLGWGFSTEAQCHLWRIRGPIGGPTTHLGACHGLAGNAMALMQVVDLMPPPHRVELYRRCVEAYEKTAIVEAGYANWRRSVGDAGWGENSLLVQWCYGASGMVTAMRQFPSEGRVGSAPQMEALLRDAAELTWHAGPLAKGSGLCHGTAGNGYAQLTMYERTGESLWLERARIFAMDAIAQYREMKARYGRGRFSLWTGDVGVALYVWQCILGTAGIPTLDYV